MTRSASLERALSSLDIRAGATRRSRLAPSESLRLSVGSATMVYVGSGELTCAPAACASCTLDGSSGGAAVVAGPQTLLRGDAFLSLGCQPITLTSQSGAELTVVPADISLAGVRPLPPFLFVDGFIVLEPAAAALAAHLGTEPLGDRLGDDMICQMMVTTLLLSAIRAWASRDRSDLPWPGPAADPFLAGVAAAVAEDPGRDWAVDQQPVDAPDRTCAASDRPSVNNVRSTPERGNDSLSAEDGFEARPPVGDGIWRFP